MEHFDELKDRLLIRFDQVLDSTLAEERRVAIEAAANAGDLLLRHFRQPQSLKYKSAKDFATVVDIEAETIIEDMVARQFPTHGFWGEEKGALGQTEEQWIIDPIDGTFNYTFGLPYFSISIALVKRGKPVVSVVCDPYHGEFFFAQREGGTWLNGERVKVSERGRMAEAMVYQDFSYDAEEQIADLERMKKIVSHIRSFRVLGSAALGMAYVSCGRLEAFFHKRLNAWDWAAASLLVEEAGGKVTDMRGMPQRFQSIPQDVVATNGRLHDGLIGLLSD